jgi:hypothetical protein
MDTQQHELDRDGEEEPERKAGLMESRPYDLALLRTLLSIDVFAPIQANLIAGLKKRQTIAEVLDREVSSAHCAIYAEAADAYTDIKGRIEVEALAALDILARAGEPMALLLAEFLGGPGVRTALEHLEGQLSPHVVPFPGRKPTANHRTGVHDVLERDDENLGGDQQTLARIGLVMRKLFNGELASDASLSPLITRCAVARSKITRTGFKPDEVQTPEIQRALAVAVPAVMELIKQLDRLLERLKSQKPEGSLADYRPTTLASLIA